MRRLNKFLLLMLLLHIAPSSAKAMKFELLPLINGSNAIFASGEIVSGDAQRFADALDRIDYIRETNTKFVVLASPGGSVDEALRMVRVMDSVGITAAVGPNTICASACASVLFISAKYHFIMDETWFDESLPEGKGSGGIGLHSCYFMMGSRSKVRSPECNERVAQNATAHGTEFGSIAMGDYIKPDDVMWYDTKLADCWGLTKWPPGTSKNNGSSSHTPQCVIDAIKDFCSVKGNCQN